jgi:hypothetical protein
MPTSSLSPLRWVAFGLFALSFGAVPACAVEDTGGTTGDDQDVTGSAVANRKDLFEGEFYFARIKNWDEGRMSPQSLRDEQQVQGAEFLLYKANKDSGAHCPDGETSDAKLVYKTKKFSLRTSGNLTNGTPKSSYKVKLEAKDDRLFDMKALNFKSMWNDVSQMREALAWRLFEKAGVPAPKHTYAKFCINNRYYGLYSMIEDVDKSFLKDRFGANKDGNLYKAYWADIGPASLSYRKKDGDDSGKQYFKAGNVDERSYQLKTNDDAEDDAAMKTYNDLAVFVKTLNGITTPGDGDAKFASAEYAQAMEKIFNVKGFLRWAGVNNMIGAWDNYWATPANYFIYNAGPKDAPKKFMERPYFQWIPWDYDNSFGASFDARRWQTASITDWEGAAGSNGGTSQPLPLLKNLLKNEKFLRYYLDHIEWLNDTFFTEQWVNAQVGDDGRGLWSRVKSAAYLESDSDSGPSHTGRQFTNHEVWQHGNQHWEFDRGGHRLEGILHFMKMRHDSVKNQLAQLRGRHPRGSSGATFPAQPESIP